MIIYDTKWQLIDILGLIFSAPNITSNSTYTEQCASNSLKGWQL